jgi:hypothetical protein
VEEVAQRPFLITTRLDSDDAIGTRFVEVVQAQFDEQEALYVDLVRGLQVDRTGQVFRYDYPLNPLISFIERRDGSPRTVFQSFRHGDSRRHAPVRAVITSPMWVQVVHGGNLMNAVRGPRVHPRAASTVEMDLPYRNSVGTVALLRERTASWARLLWLWARHPRQMKDYLSAKGVVAQGTQTLPARGEADTHYGCPRPARSQVIPGSTRDPVTGPARVSTTLGHI